MEAYEQINCFSSLLLKSWLNRSDLPDGHLLAAMDVFMIPLKALSTTIEKRLVYKLLVKSPMLVTNPFYLIRATNGSYP